VQEQGAINLQRAPLSARVACCKRRSQLSHCGSSAKNFDLHTCVRVPPPFNYCVNQSTQQTLLLITTRARVSSGRADTCSSAYQPSTSSRHWTLHGDPETKSCVTAYRKRQRLEKTLLLNETQSMTLVTSAGSAKLIT
jgi:hypothetical protein